MNDVDKILAEIIKDKGGDKTFYRNLMDAIAYHESAGTMSPTLKQFGGGPGRGKYQFEEGIAEGAITAARRAKQYLESKGLRVPNWLSDIYQNESLDASTLTSEQQDVLFLGNMRMHPRADFSKVVNGEEDIQDFWANYHWAGDEDDRDERIESFNKSFNRYKNNRSSIQSKNNQLPLPEQARDNTIVKPVKLNQNLLNISPNNDMSDLVSYIKSNKKFDPEGDGYDFETAYNYNIEPDSTGHWPSRIPETGQLLKGRKHPTYNKTIEGENNAGYKIFQGDDGKYYSQPQLKLNDSLANGGLLNEFNNGGLHETNPFGGIPIGNNSTVEEGETSANLPIGKFIFSDRISLADGGPIDPPTKTRDNTANITRGPRNSSDLLEIRKEPRRQAPWIREDKTTIEERQRRNEAMDRVNESDIDLLKRPLIYLANPLKLPGDILDAVGTRRNPFPTSEEDRVKTLMNKHAPNKEDSQRLMDEISLAGEYLPQATINTLFGAAAAPRAAINSVLKEIFLPTGDLETLTEKQVEAIKDEISRHARSEYGKILTDEGIERLRKIGVDTDRFKSTSDFKLTKNAERPSFFMSQGPSKREMNINTVEHIENFDTHDFSPTSIVSHEMGHLMQSKDFLDSNIDIGDISSWGMGSTSLDKTLGNLDLKNYSDLTGTGQKNAAYFLYGSSEIPKSLIKDDIINKNPSLLKGQFKDVYEGPKGEEPMFVKINERLPFLREMRQRMVEKKYIEDIYEDISEETIAKFLKENPKNRISTIIKHTPENFKKLKEALKIAPVVGAGVAGANANEKAMGGIIDPPDKNKQIVSDSKDFVKNWFNDPITKTRYSLNKGRGFGETLPDIVSGLNQLDKTNVEYNVPTSDKSRNAGYKGNTISFYKDPTEETATHEWTHAMGIDDDLTNYIRKNYGTPAKAIQDRTGLPFKEALSQELNINPEGFTGKSAINQEILHSRYLSENGELYPRIMEMRKVLGVKPGDIIDDSHIKTLKEKTKNPLFKYYTDEQIKSMLNTLASTQNTNNYNNLV